SRSAGMRNADARLCRAAEPGLAGDGDAAGSGAGLRRALASSAQLKSLRAAHSRNSGVVQALGTLEAMSGHLVPRRQRVLREVGLQLLDLRETGLANAALGELGHPPVRQPRGFTEGGPVAAAGLERGTDLGG